MDSEPISYDWNDNRIMCTDYEDINFIDSFGSRNHERHFYFKRESCANANWSKNIFVEI